MSRERKEDMSSYGEGQTHQLMDALESKGRFSPDEITRLGQFRDLPGIKAVLNGQSEIRPVGESGVPLWLPIGDGKTQILVNLGATPRLSFDGAEVVDHNGGVWTIVEKRKNGLYVGGQKIILSLSKRQQGGNSLTGHELREELTGKLVQNANLLDALYENVHLIPEDWKKDDRGNIRFIYFWGTIYRRPASGRLCVRYLCFGDGAWHRFCGWLGRGWSSSSPAALLASN